MGEIRGESRECQDAKTRGVELFGNSFATAGGFPTAVPQISEAIKWGKILEFIYTIATMRKIPTPQFFSIYATCSKGNAVDGDQKILSEIEIFRERIRARPDTGVKSETRAPAHK